MRHLTSLLVALSAAATSAAAQMPGYAPASAEAQRALEADAVRRPDSASAMRHSRALAGSPHVAGTEGQARTRDHVVEAMRAMGLDAEARAYEVWLPHAVEARLWRVAPDTLELPLIEPPIPEDPYTQHPQYPTVNGYSGEGDVSAEIVYVNYGLPEDYAVLDSMGVSVAGKLVLARYGRSYRGIKAREAEARGGVGLLLYSDPLDDGFAQGAVYPEGPMRPERGVQRGSVKNGNGDPSTPDWPSTEGARRLPPDSMSVPRIPVVPIGWSHAAELLRDVRGASVPQRWQGGMPFRYHVGPGPVRARLVVRTDAATNGYKTIWNTLATVRGSEFPDETIVIGAHRDGWGTGAIDNVSGTVSVLEAARAVSGLVKAGHRPKRTLVFATWDAEEWGLIGSTEHVEEFADALRRGGVAYLNQDVAASGPRFGGGGSPSLRAVLRDVARGVPDPSGRGSVYQVWRELAGIRSDTLEPMMGDPGGGSDFAGFYNHLGIPHADWGFGGAGGVYHSAYDTPRWMETFGDPGYRYHAAAARVAAAMLLRLANADVLPYDYAEFAHTLRRQLQPLERRLQESGATAAPLDSALLRLHDAAVAFAATRDSALAGGAPSRAVRERANRALLDVERALTRPEGLRTRPWFRGLIYAADEDNGYATVIFPPIAEALRRADVPLIRAEVADLATRVGAATAAVERARSALVGR